jgi:ATP-dependent phosphofructokinase / diphosphate-dependent phosphofructokinase
MPKRIGVLTGGGDCPGLNAVVASLVKSGISEGYQFIGFKKGFEGLLDGGDYINLDLDAVRGITHLGGTILQTVNRGHFSSKIGHGIGKKIEKTIFEESVKTLRELEVDCLVAIGGDGTLSTAYQFEKYGIKIIGVPKTIDNDLEATDKTFGFSTGVDIIAESMGRIQTTAVSHGRVVLVETMGRNTGWLTLYGGIAGGADVILIPEIPFEYQKIIEFIRERRLSDRYYTVIAVAEGAIAKGEKQTVRSKAKDGENQLGGISYQIAHKLEKLAPEEFEIRVVVLGHLQRGGSPNAEDIILSQRFGFGALTAIKKHFFGYMVTLKGQNITFVPISEAVRRLKKVDPNSEVVKTAKGIGIFFGSTEL